MHNGKFEITGRELGILNNMLNYLCHAIPFDSERLQGRKEEFKALLKEIGQRDFRNDSHQLDFDLPKLKRLETAFLALEHYLKDSSELSCLVDDAELVWGLQNKLDEFIAAIPRP